MDINQKILQMLQQMSGQMSDLTDRVSDLEKRKAGNNCSQSTMQQAIPQELQRSSSLVSPFASTRNPYENTKTEVNEVNVLKVSS